MTRGSAVAAAAAAAAAAAGCTVHGPYMGHQGHKWGSVSTGSTDITVSNVTLGLLLLEVGRLRFGSVTVFTYQNRTDVG
jgi:hypothetical protein